MGNQLVGIAPSQIFPVEHYLTNLPNIEFDKSLGSTRFFKVARAKSQEGLIVVKVFAIHDFTLPIQLHKKRLEEIRNKLYPVFNCVPFQSIIITEKAGLLMREFVKYSLYDRISTRPFLSNIEKKWITFQILYAIHQCHKVGVCHGDIKLENICMTSWNWIMLVDFASFKPTFLPEDNPADYSYFFDTSRRRTCYIAPERFIKGFNCDLTQNTMFNESFCNPSELKPAMDIFSIGCCLLELWNEGHAPFDLSQLLLYHSGEYTPKKHLDSIQNENLRSMISSMLEKNPSKRLSSEEYLDRERGKFFPEYFYSFLQSYMLIFSSTPILPPDEKISRLKKDISNVITILKSSENDDDGVVIMITLVISCVRGLLHCTSKLQSLDILYELSLHTTADIILDRILPHIMYFYQDQWSRVRSSAINTITKCLKLITKVPRSDANIFPEYILPGLIQLSNDSSTQVRCVLAQNIADLADLALKFLEQTCIECEIGSHGPKINYELELLTLHEMFQQIVSSLLTDHENIVKQTLMENGITKFCVFFGKQKANDIILSHMITFLNDKEDTSLRISFFENIVGVAAYVGCQSSSILTPLLQQGFTDRSEFVIAKAINTASSLTELGLLTNSDLREIVCEVVKIGLIHPGTWIRLATAGLVATAAKTLGPLDTQCKIAPLVNDYFKYPLIQIDKTELLLQALVPPIPRIVYDDIVKNPDILSYLKLIKQAENAIHTGISPPLTVVPSNLKNLYRKLTNEGMTVFIEDKILKMSNALLKISAHKNRGVNEIKKNSCDLVCDGRLDISSFNVQSHKIDLQLHCSKILRKNTLGNLVTQNIDNSLNTMNSEWQHMFGGIDDRSQNEILSHGEKSSSGLLDIVISHDINSSDHSNGSLNVHEKSFIQVVVPECRIELRSLEVLQQNRYTTSIINKERVENATWRPPIPPPEWKLKGCIVAHLHEHRSAVTRLLPFNNGSGINSNTSETFSTGGMFASSSMDGTVRLWDCKKMEGKNIANRSKHIYQTNVGGIVQMALCDQGNSLSLIGRDGSLSLLRLEKPTITKSTNFLLPSSTGTIDVCTLNDSTVIASTMLGDVIAVDLRQPGQAWRIEGDLKNGLPTAMCLDTMKYSWLTLATLNGHHTTWDLRFRLPIVTFSHPAKVRVRKLACHPIEHSWIISSVQGNNEISIWNLETRCRESVLWASPAPPLSTSAHSAGEKTRYELSLYSGIVDRNAFLMSAGTDYRVRFWNLDDPNKSYIAVPAPDDACAPNFDNLKIDGINVIKETWNDTSSGHSKIPSESESLNQHAGGAPEAPAPGHRTPITDITLCQAEQCFLVTSSSDGLISVWK